MPESLRRVGGLDEAVVEGPAGDRETAGGAAEGRDRDGDDPESGGSDGEGLADRSVVGRLRDDLSEPLGKLRDTVEELKLEADAATRAHNAAESSAARFDQTLGHLQILEGLDTDHAEVAQGEAAAEASKAARPVVTSVGEHDDARKQQAAATRARDVGVGAIAEAFAELGLEVDPSSAAVVATTLGHEQVRHKRDSELLAARTRAATVLETVQDATDEAVNELRAKVQERDVVAARATNIEETELPQLLEGFTDPEAISVDLGATTASIEGHGTLAKLAGSLTAAREAQTSATADYDRIFEAFVATEAPRLAESLTESEPCPVCGSVTHPSPARIGRGPRASSEDVQVAAEALQRTNVPVDELVAQVAQARAGLGADVDVSVDQLKARETRLRKQLETASATAKRIAILRTELDESRNRVVGLEKVIAGLQVAATNAQAQLSEAAQLLSEARGAAEGIDVSEVNEREALLGRIETAAEGLDSLFTAVATAGTSVTESEKRLSSALAQSRFESVEDADCCASRP